MNVLNEVKKCIATILGISVDSIGDNAHLQTDLFADSLDILNIKLSLEDKFSIVFTDDDLANILVVSDICRCVEERLNEQNGS